MVNIEIDGKPLEVRDGAMIIEAADQAGIKIPRFCYHKKLSIAANCRMCLVEVEKMRKPMPACATPVGEGMKVFTRSPLALSAQKGTMEFLLINHPLDCPICDQGGECELQDVAMGYGGDVSRFGEMKRVVPNPNIGPLISTDMTRCIHCTRCVRFGDEVAGIRELGATGRGEHTKIGTYVKHTVSSELSGNVIDLCPVGALTSKPFRFRARAWELTQFSGVAPHDSLGSNVYLHVHRGRLVRVVPRDNESLNETWLSDRDRFSYEGANHESRLTKPQIKRDGEWVETDWNTALAAAVDGLRKAMGNDAGNLGALASPVQTTEELYLLQKLLRGVGSNHIDHRLRQVDFSDQSAEPRFPALGIEPQALENCNAALVIGSNIRKEQPLLSLRLRKAALRGADISLVNPVGYAMNYRIANSVVVAPSAMVATLAGIAKAAHGAKGGDLPASISGLVSGANADTAAQAIAKQLADGESAAVLLGNLAAAHPAYATLRALAAYIAQATGASFGYLSAANSAGAWLAGAVPHRAAGGERNTDGLNAAAMLAQPRKGYLLLGIEPGLDFDNSGQAMAALGGADFVVALSAFESPCLRANADVLLPIAAYGETSGTYVNGLGQWQSFAGAVQPQGDARPAWKVLRVMANLFDLGGFTFNDSQAVLDELKAACGTFAVDNSYGFPALAAPGATSVNGVERIGEVPAYAADMLVRRAPSLQETPDGQCSVLRANAATAQKLGLADGGEAKVTQGDATVTLPVVIDDAIAEGSVWVPAGVVATAGLGAGFGTVQVEKS